MKDKRAVFCIILILMLGFSCSDKDNPAGSSGLRLLPVDFMKTLAGSWILMRGELAVYDTTSGAVIDQDTQLFWFEAMGSFNMLGTTFYGEKVNSSLSPNPDTLYWVVDNEKALLYSDPDDASPKTELMVPFRKGHSWIYNPHDPAEDQVTAEIVHTDTTLIMRGGIFPGVLHIQHIQETPVGMLTYKYFFQEDRGYVSMGLLFHTFTGKLFFSMLYETMEMGSAPPPSLVKTDSPHPLFRKYPVFPFRF